RMNAFERKKAEEEAKKRREEAETAAVLKEYEEEFDPDDGMSANIADYGAASNSTVPPRGGFSSGAPGRRHFTGNMRNSGPGSLGPVPPMRNSGPGSLGPMPSMRNSGPGSLGPPPSSMRNSGPGSLGGPPSLSKKRTRDDSSSDPDTGSNNRRSRIAPEFREAEKEEEQEEEEERRAAPKPTVRVSNLPPKTLVPTVKSLFTKRFNVLDVHSDPPTGPSTGERKSAAMIVVLEGGTPQGEVDTFTATLNNRYMNRGYYLKANRHFASSSLTQGPRDTAQLFGRQLVKSVTSQFAPHTFNRQSDRYEVQVKIPSDLKKIKLINKTVEKVIKYGAAFEALLMTQHYAINDEKWAFLWDARSSEGVYYRFRIWSIVSGYSARQLAAGRGGRRSEPQPVEVFNYQNTFWQPPRDSLKFEWATSLDDFVSDPDYDSSSDDDSENEGRPRKFNRGGAPAPDMLSEQKHLNPYDKAQLIWLLTGLPTTTGQLAKAHIAAVMVFTVSHAERGIDEIVRILINNVEKPYAMTSANQRRQQRIFDEFGPEDYEMDTDEAKFKRESKARREKEELQMSKLIGLFCISDILSASATASIPGTWKIRGLFEKALLERKVFTKLARLDRDLDMGKIKADKWKRSVNGILSQWASWGTFSKDNHRKMVEAFANPILTAEEKEAEAKRAKE
ncbi:hypothetical protein GQ43DRAFT_360713, partial [Delitschia confertaspora ATCC 74209]